MDHLFIEKKQNTLMVVLDKENKTFLFEGRSFPENTVEFFKPVMQWLDEYKNDPVDETIVNMNLVYFNTSSAKYLLNVMNQFELIFKAGNKVKIIWHYIADDEDLMEAGEEYSTMFSIPFEPAEHDEEFTYDLNSRESLSKSVLDGNELLENQSSNFTSSPNLDDLIGEYYSDELNETYFVNQVNAELVVHSNLNEEVVLIPLRPDFYVSKKYWFKEVQFIRDNNNCVNSFILKTENDNTTSNLRFIKLAVMSMKTPTI